MFALGAVRCRRDIGRGFARGGPTSRAVVVTLFTKKKGQFATRWELGMRRLLMRLHSTFVSFAVCVSLTALARLPPVDRQ
eukprot:scaffold58169_cov68-Phaeocystis_antarctica.AAC.2